MRWSSRSSKATFPILPNVEYEVSVDVHVPPHGIDAANGLYVGEACVLPLVEPGAGVRTAVLPGQEAGTVTLHFKNAGWVPALVLPGSEDNRELGVAVRSITLRARSAPAEITYDAITGAVLE